jgi:hypothetical protein
MSLRFERAKKLHDPLAAAALLREDIFRWEEVVPVAGSNTWGSRPLPGSGIWAAVHADEPAFRRLLVGNADSGQGLSAIPR